MAPTAPTVPYHSAPVYSVFGRPRALFAAEGDYTVSEWLQDRGIESLYTEGDMKDAGPRHIFPWPRYNVRLRSKNPLKLTVHIPVLGHKPKTIYRNFTETLTAKPKTLT
jgi:hypothetical protein